MHNKIILVVTCQLIRVGFIFHQLIHVAQVILWVFLKLIQFGLA